jgi:hypothetical protein
MPRYSFDFKILTNRFPFKWGGEQLNNFMRVIRETIDDVTTQINALYDDRFLIYATGLGLDYWGEVLNLKRATGESDSVYRARLLVAFRDIQNSLTIDAYKDAIEAVTSERPDCLEHYKEIFSWPFTWGNPFYDYIHRNIVSFVIPDELTEEQLNEISDDLQSVKLATLYVWLVEDSGLGYYKLRKEIL